VFALSALALPDNVTAPPGKDWEWFRLTPTVNARFLDGGNGTFELVTVKGASHKPLLFNSKWNGDDAYVTGDLLAPHPTKEGFWKIFGRADDQIMLSNGEKVRLLSLSYAFASTQLIEQTNPGPLGKLLLKHAVYSL
jgi:hypothetical protein